MEPVLQELVQAYTEQGLQLNSPQLEVASHTEQLQQEVVLFLELLQLLEVAALSRAA